MAESYPANVDIVYAEGERNYQHTIRNALNDKGFRGIRTCNDLNIAAGAIKLVPPDVLVVDARMEGGAAVSLIKQLRHNKIGKNPFLSVIVTCDQPDRGVFDRIADSGLDYLIVKPFPPSQLVRRINAIAKKRKPFAVTSDYIGPDRRDLIKPREDDEEVTLIEVPNTLGMKAKGVEVDLFELEKLVFEVMDQINDARLNRNAHRIGFLIKRIIRAIENGTANGQSHQDADRILEISRDISDRVPKGDSDHITRICKALIDLMQQVVDGHYPLEGRSLELLTAVAGAVVLCFETDLDSVGFAEQVADMVQDAIH